MESEKRPTLDEIVDIIKHSYSFVLMDNERGARYISECSLKLKEKGCDEEAEKLLQLTPHAIEVIATDDRKSDVAFLKIFLVPKNAPVVQFFTEEHRLYSQFLLDRLSQSLEMEITVIEPKSRT